MSTLETDSRIENAGDLANTICAFWLGETCYGLDVSMVGGVADVDHVLPVPGTSSTVRGLCNIRASALAVIDTSELLDLPSPKTRAVQRVLILRTGGMECGLVIDRVQGVIRPGTARTIVAASSQEHAAVDGLLEPLDQKDVMVTLLDEEYLRQRLASLRFTKADASLGG